MKHSEKTVLTFHGKSIHSLKELRENFQKEECLTALNNGTLYNWLSVHYYEKEAQKIKELTETDSDQCFKMLCDIFSLDPSDFLELSEEEKRVLEAKKERITKLTSDKKILTNILLTAENQEELAKLLDDGETEIYLCEETFSIPLSKKGITYTGIGNVILEPTFTKEQYKRSGITIKNICLPAESDAATEEYALNAAIENGYDPFGEKHADLTTAFHNKLKFWEFSQYLTLPRRSYQVMGKFYNRESECKTAKRNALLKEYHAAENYLSPNHADCIANLAASHYGNFIKNALSPYLKELKTCFPETDENFKRIEVKIGNAEKNLKKIFETELQDDYYQMYEFEYFDKQTEIEEHDYRYSEDLFGKFLDSLRSDSIQYTISDITEAVSEMENDLNDYASTFFHTAYSDFLEYVREIEDAVEIFAQNLPPFQENEEIDDYFKRKRVVSFQ